MLDFQRKRESESLSAIPIKANRILHIVLFLMLIIAFRVWHLTVIQHEKKIDEAFRSRKRVILEPSPRGTIRDRFNVILAKNNIEYQLGIIYSEFNEVPLVAYEKNANGEQKRVRLRKEYISSLSSIIAKEIGDNKERIEDLIYAYAPFYGHAPLIIKRGLSESEYYRLRMLEKDWPGLCLICSSKRSYPKGRIGSHILGYLGPIPQTQYQKLMTRVSELSEYIKASEVSLDNSFSNDVIDAEKELHDLRERFYTLNDAVGVMGIESSFEKDLRGYVGKRIFLSSPKGYVIRDLPGSRQPLPGRRVMLTISIELQEFAEKLLALCEKDRSTSKEFPGFKVPWTKGGAIVAIDPVTGEVLALASYPRFDPNDFSNMNLSSKFKNNAFSWLENEPFFSDVWDQNVPLQREFFDDKHNMFSDDKKYLLWNDFLKFALPIDSPILSVLDEKKTIKELALMQSSFDEIMNLAPSHTPQEVIESFFSQKEQDYTVFGQAIMLARSRLLPLFNKLENVKEKLIMMDLSRLVISYESLPHQLLEKIGDLSIGSFRNLSSAHAYIKERIKKDAKILFREHQFKKWRNDHEKSFLKEIRANETKKKIAHRPYLDYLDKEERRQFDYFIDRYQYLFYEYAIRHTTDLGSDELSILQPYFDRFENLFADLSQNSQSSLIKEGLIFLKKEIADFNQEVLIQFFKSMKSSSDLVEQALGNYRGVGGKDLKQIIMAVLKGESAGTLRSHGFRQSTIQGSIFKLVTAYAGLKQRYDELNGNLTMDNASPFEIVDKTSHENGRTFVGTFMDGRRIPQQFKGGRIPKSLRASIGKVDLVKALETSSNPYFSLLASEFLKNPDLLSEAARDFGYGEKSGIAIPGELRGEVPSDLKFNKTGLYATAIGQHTLVTTPLQTALMISAIANKGTLLTPKITSLTIGRNLSLPSLLEDTSNEVIEYPVPARRSIFLPDSIRRVLLEGMKCATKRAYDEKGSLAIKYSQQHPEMHEDFIKMKGQFIGKSSTSEVMERMGINLGFPAFMYRHIWFGGISFDPKGSLKQGENHPFIFSDKLGKPELVVVVYLRYAGYGKEVAPIAASVAAKWREILSRRAFAEKKE